MEALVDKFQFAVLLFFGFFNYDGFDFWSSLIASLSIILTKSFSCSAIAYVLF